MTTTTRSPLARPSVAPMTLHSGEPAVVISAGGQRIIIRREHLEAFLDDLTEHEEHA